MDVKGYTAATLLTDTGLALDAHAGAYTFKNYDESFLGPILYRNALGNSRNIPAAQVLQSVGIDVAYRHFCDLGLVRTREDPSRCGLGMSIGGLYVTLADLVRAYGVLTNDGRSFELQWFPRQRIAHHAQLIQSDIARQITLFLSDPMARLPSFSRMGSLEYPFPVAVKTGTSKGYRDAWCVAYSDTYIAGVWVGHPDNYPMKKRTGADSAAQLVHRIMETLHPERMDGMCETGFPPPPGYIARRICMLTGKLATDETQHVALEWFKPGTEPVEKSDVYRKVAIDARTGRPALPDCPAELIRQKTYVALDERFAAWAKQSGGRSLDEPSPRHRHPGEPPGRLVRRRQTVRSRRLSLLHALEAHPRPPHLPGQAPLRPGSQQQGPRYHPVATLIDLLAARRSAPVCDRPRLWQDTGPQGAASRPPAVPLVSHPGVLPGGDVQQARRDVRKMCSDLALDKIRHQNNVALEFQEVQVPGPRENDSGDALTTGESATRELLGEIVGIHNDDIQLAAGKLIEER